MSQRSATALSFGSTIGLYLVFWIAGEFGNPAWSTSLNESLLKAVLWISPTVAILALAYRLSPAGALREIGLVANPLAGIAFGVVSAIPLITLWFGTPLSTVSAPVLAGTSLIGPLAEEVLFRGLLFRQLVRQARRRPVWAMATSAIVFGAAHLTMFFGFEHGHFSYAYNAASPLLPYLNEFGLTALGGLLFAWITYRWNSLWPAIGLHCCLNLSWQLTHAADAVTPFAAATTRLATMTIAVYVTWRATRGKRTASRAFVSAAGVGSS